MTTLYDIADAIMDSSIEEHRESNLASVDSVIQYADAAMDIDISNDEAKTIWDHCTKMQKRLSAGEIPSTNDWYHDFEKPLQIKVL